MATMVEMDATLTSVFKGIKVDVALSSIQDALAFTGHMVMEVAAAEAPPSTTHPQGHLEEEEMHVVQLAENLSIKVEVLVVILLQIHFVYRS